MIIVDNALKALEQAGKPIKVGMIGAGFMGRGIANQIVNSVPGLRLVAISNRRIESARRAYTEAGVDDFRVAERVSDIEDSVRQGKYAITEDALLICRAEGIDALVEVTGDVEFGAHVAMEAIHYRKHIILMNAELDGTIGPILKVYADRAGVIFTACDGDQPGVEMNLYRFVKGIGLTPLMCGNIKGLQDPYRTPITQEGFAKHWGQKPHMVTSFADGTKISFEQAIVANGTGMKVIKRGMLGYEFTGHVDDLKEVYGLEQLRKWGGVVDYVVGAKPAPGVFVLAVHDDPKQRHYLNLYKLGGGPLYSFYTPYHLCHFELPNSIARAFLFQDAVLAPLGAPLVEVVTTAKTNLKAGDTIDPMGYFMTYGQCENTQVAEAEDLLPVGLAEGCRLKRDVPKDKVLTLSDVEFPKGRLCDRLWDEQNKHFKCGKRRTSGEGFDKNYD